MLPGHAARLLPFVGLMIAAVLVVVLSHQNRQLQHEVAELTLRERLPHTGTYVPPLPVTTSTGASALVGQPPEGKRQVLFIFNTTCSYCEASLPAWEAIGARLRETDAAAELYAVSLHDQETTAAYIALHRLSIPSVALPGRRFARLYRASVVPLTLVIDDEGRVRYARPGVIRRGVVMDSILDAAGITPVASPQREDRSAGARRPPSSS